MSNARDFFTSSMADALLPSLRRSFEDVVYETLDHRQVPTRTDFKDLRDQLNALRGQLAGSTGGVKKLSEDMDALDDRVTALEDRLGALEAKVEQLSRSATAPVRQSAPEPEAHAATPAEAHAEPAAEGAVDENRKVCQVPDCGETVRSKGFCARHYQLWRRGRLDGFPTE